MHVLKSYKIKYLAFIAPFILAFLSWLYFPVIAQWILANIFRYPVSEQAANVFWTSAIRLFYTWYTFVAIGVAGVWILAAFFARKRKIESGYDFFPMVSFVVPAFNQEKNIGCCLASLFRCSEKYEGNCEIIVVDDGSSDFTYEAAWSAVRLGRSEQPRVRCKVMRHFVNIGKIEALKTGINRAQGSLVAIVDADSEWLPDILTELANYMKANGKQAVTGYVHPKGEGSRENLIVRLQRLEYSGGLSVGRCAQGLGNNVIVVSGALGLYDARLLREVLGENNIHSATEDLEMTLALHRKGAKVGYMSFVQSATVVPKNLGLFWRQRLRWFTGWLHNTLNIHRDLMGKRSWLAILLWYSYLFEYAGAFIDLAALAAFPFLWWLAPDPFSFGLNLLVFVPYSLLIGLVSHAIALRFAYGSSRRYSLLFYLPLYSLLRLVNDLARCRSIVDYLKGNNGKWHY